MGEWFFTVGLVCGVLTASIVETVWGVIRRRGKERARWRAWHARAYRCDDRGREEERRLWGYDERL